MADGRKRTLLDFRYRSSYRAGRGAHGSGSKKNGRQGDDLLIPVPPGTVVSDADSGEILVDLVREGERWVAARGGRGGFGNARFATPTDRAPRRSEPGGAGEARRIRLELKILADAGLVGLPNAGKSTFLARVSAARPKIADYPFTTLAPNLGLVQVGDGESFLLADIPGLIEGASEGKGLGHDFLRHIERCRVLIYLVDATSDDPIRDLAILREELRRYREDLAVRPSLVAWNKIDAVADVDALPAPEGGVWKISAASGAGVKELIFEIRRRIREGEQGEPGEEGDDGDEA